MVRALIWRGLWASLLIALFQDGAAEPARWQSLALGYFPGADQVGALEGDPPAAAVQAGGELVGYVLLTDRIAPLPGYSGQPISTLVGLDLAGRISGVDIIEHEEPILVVGITPSDLERHVRQYHGTRVFDRVKVGGEAGRDEVVIDGISGATITVMVLNAAIMRSAQKVAQSRGIPLTGDASRAAERLLEQAATAREPGAGADAGDSATIWRAAWTERRGRIVWLIAGLGALTIILVLQDWLTRHASLIRHLRTGFLIYTLLFLGWYALGQLSIINVLTFTHAVMHEFRWETFLIDPITFILWSFVAVTLLLWGRGIYCGWLCPFGALQELVNKGAARLGAPQIEIPELVHERLLAVKYIVLLGLFGLSLQSIGEAARYAEVEPFKTAISLRFDREWPFVAYALALVLISTVNSKFFCKYLCPLGAALTIPSHFRIFDWLHRRKECGHPCQICAKECPSQAIAPTGEINLLECHYCLECQITFWNSHKCPPLVERRKRLERMGQKAKPRI